MKQIFTLFGVLGMMAIIFVLLVAAYLVPEIRPMLVGAAALLALGSLTLGFNGVSLAEAMFGCLTLFGVIGLIYFWITGG